MAEPQSMASVNAVLDTFAPGWTLDCLSRLHCSPLWLRGPEDRALIVRLNRDRLWLAGAGHRLGMGGVTEQAIVQLVLWCRDQPRVPMAWWLYACSEKIGLGSSETIRLLKASDYGDPARTCCVLCGAANPTDWWSLAKVLGPCCWMGRCNEVRS